MKVNGTFLALCVFHPWVLKTSAFLVQAPKSLNNAFNDGRTKDVLSPSLSAWSSVNGEMGYGSNAMDGRLAALEDGRISGMTGRPNEVSPHTYVGSEYGSNRMSPYEYGNPWRRNSYDRRYYGPGAYQGNRWSYDSYGPRRNWNYNLPYGQNYYRDSYGGRQGYRSGYYPSGYERFRRENYFDQGRRYGTYGGYGRTNVFESRLANLERGQGSYWNRGYHGYGYGDRGYGYGDRGYGYGDRGYGYGSPYGSYDNYRYTGGYGSYSGPRYNWRSSPYSNEGRRSYALPPYSSYGGSGYYNNRNYLPYRTGSQGYPLSPDMSYDSSMGYNRPLSPDSY